MAAVDRPRGITWLPDDSLVFAPSQTNELFRIPAAGGEPEPVTTLDASRGEVSHRWPRALPGGAVVVFTSGTSPSEWETARIEAVTLGTGERKVLVSNASFPLTLPTGHLAYLSGQTLFAVPFDARRLEVTGAPVPVLNDIAVTAVHGADS